VKKQKTDKKNKLFRIFKNQGFLTGAVTLAGAGIICRLLGIAFRIPLANIVQNYGMGLYQMVFPVYALLLIISSAGVPVAISKMVAQGDPGRNTKEIEDNKSPEQTYPPTQILVNALILLGVIGLVVSGIFIGISFPIARLQDNVGIGKIYMAIAPAIFFVCLIAAFRGYFQGLRNMIPTATSQIVEQIVKVGAGLTLAITLYPFGVYWAVFGAILAVTISEFFAFVYLLVVYLVHRKRIARSDGRPSNAKDNGCNSPRATNGRPYNKGKKTLHKKVKYVSWGLMWVIVKKSFPITLMASVFPLILVFDSLVVVRMLTDADTSAKVATQLYGISSGTVHTLINMPAVLGMAIGTAVVPMTAALFKKGDRQEFQAKSTLAVKLAVVITLFFALFYIVFARQIILLLYEQAFRSDPEQLTIATNLLKIESVMILLMGLSQIFTSMLQGAGKAKWPLLAILTGAAIKIAVQMPLIRTDLGIYAVSIGNVLCFAVAFTLNVIFAWKFLGLRPKFDWNVLKIFLIACSLSGILIGLMFGLPDGKWWVILAGVIALFAYVLAVWLMRVFGWRRLYKSKR